MKKIFTKTSVLALTTAVLLSSCASIVSRSSYPVYIRTNPAGATVTITDKHGMEVYKGTSPSHVTLRSGAGFFSKAQYQVKLTSDGYSEKIVPINYKVNGWYFGNLLIGGVVGMLIIDPATGAMWRIIDPIVDETLDKSLATAKTAPSLSIVDFKNVPEDLKKRIVRVN